MPTAVFANLLQYS